MPGAELIEPAVRQAMAVIAANPQQTLTPFAVLVDNGKPVQLTSQRDPKAALEFFRGAIRPRPGTTFYALIWEGVMAEFYPDRPAAATRRAVFAETGDDLLPDANVMAYGFTIKESGLFRRKREIVIQDTKLIYAAMPSRIFANTAQS